MIGLSISRRLFLPSLLVAGAMSRIAWAAPVLTMDVFRGEVIEVGRRRLPDMAIEPGPSASEIRSKDHQLQLGNIYRAVRDLPPSSREALIVDWLSRFSPAADAKADAIKNATDDWDKAQPLLRPKLLGRLPPIMQERLISAPFVGPLTIVYVIDLGDKDLYVSKDKAAKWQVAQDFIHSRAVANLESMSSGLGRQPHDDKGALLDIRLGDGYDAGRLILPGLRTRLLSILGSPFHAAVPARDLMMVWSTGDTTFETDMASQVRDAALSMDHPVSALVYVADERGVRLI